MFKLRVNLYCMALARLVRCRFLEACSEVLTNMTMLNVAAQRFLNAFCNDIKHSGLF